MPLAAGHPAFQALENAPLEDEEISESEERAVADAREDVRAGRVLTHEEVKRHWLAE